MLVLRTSSGERTARRGCRPPRGTVARRICRAAGAFVLALIAAWALVGCTGSGPSTTSVPSGSTGAGTTTTYAPSGQNTSGASPRPTQGPFAGCRDCHAFLDVPGKVPQSLKSNFSHTKHLSYESVSCASCHRLPVHVADGERRPLMADCFACHGQEPGAQAPGRCDLCHPADLPRKPSSHTTAFVQGGHAAVAAQQGAKECVICHQGSEQTVCRQCHGIDLPHPASFLPSATGPGGHVAAAYADPKLCARCHHTRQDLTAGCYGGTCHAA